MALQSSTGYVRIAISTGYDETKLNVNWLTFATTDWRESNPSQVWIGIEMQGSYQFDLAIKETISVPLEEPYEQDDNGEDITHEDQEITTGYLPQSREQAEELLRNLSVKGADFASVNFYDGNEEIPQEIVPLWKPDLNVKEGEKYAFYTDEWRTYIVLQDHTTQLNWTPDRANTLWELWDESEESEEFPEWQERDESGDYRRYQVGEKCSYNGDHWVNNYANNTYKPDVYGWTKI